MTSSQVWVRQDAQLTTIYEKDAVSPKIKKFVDGLVQGTASNVNFSLLLSKGFTASSDGSIFRVESSVRSYEQQVELYKKGRQLNYNKIKQENKANDYLTGQYYEITNENKTGSVVTNTWGGGSFHNYGLAVDIIFTTVGYNNSIEWLGSKLTMKEFYKQTGLVRWAYACGLTWGGDWTDFLDVVHFQDDSYKLPAKYFLTRENKKATLRLSKNCNFAFIKDFNKNEEKTMYNSQNTVVSGGSVSASSDSTSPFVQFSNKVLLLVGGAIALALILTNKRR